MTQLTLRNITTEEDIAVPPEGFIIGRVGGDADVQLEDKGISRRQARVSLRGGRWLLETLAVPQGARAPRPLQLETGTVFAVGKHEFEIVDIAEAEEPEIEEEELDASAKTVAPRRGQPAMSAGPTRRPAPPVATPANTRTAAPPPKRPSGPTGAQQTEMVTPKESPAPKTAPAAKNQRAPQGASAEPEEKGVGALFVAVPKGLAYYLLNVPKLLANPLGTVRRAVDELPAEPMGKIELIGYALPAMLATGLLGSFAGGIALLISPAHTFSLMSFIPIVPIISAVIGAVITGFIWHPVMEWIIDKLKGESDARSRTNYFLQMMTVSIVVAVPQALGTIVGALPIPFINLLGPLLGVVASLVTFYVVYQWWVTFKVVKWVYLVLKVLAAVTVIFSAIGLVQGVIGTIRSFGNSSSASVAAATNDAEAAIAAAEAQAAAAVAAAGADLPPEAQKALEEAKARAAEAMKEAKEAAEAAAAKQPSKTEKAEAPAPAPVAAINPAPSAPALGETAKAAPTASGAYGAFARRREAIEKTFENDPTVLRKSRDLQQLYSELNEQQYELEKKWSKETSKNPEHAPLNARLKEAEFFERSQKTVNALSEKLGIP